MANFSPIDYGAPVAAKTQGISELQSAEQQHAQKNIAEIQQVGGFVGAKATEITQGIIHTQTLKATAALKSQQADVINFIEQNPTVAKDDVAKYMSSDDYQAWHAALGQEFKNSDKVPMYTVASDLFNSASKKAREEAGQLISPMAPGVRDNWMDTAALEAATTKELRVDRIAAGQMVADHRAQTMGAFEDMLNKAVLPRDIDDAIAGISGSPWLHPAEREAAKQKALRARDSLGADQAMRAMDVPGMERELIKLEKPDAAQSYQHLDERERVALSGQLRTHIKAAQADDAHQDTIIDKWKKSQDHETLGYLIQQISNGQAPPLAGTLNQRKFDGMAADPDVAKRGYFDPQSQAEAYHLLEGFYKSQKAGKDVSDPAALAALTDFFVKDPDGFVKKLIGGKSFTYRDSYGALHQLDPTEQLTPSDYNRMLGYVKDWKDPVRARAEELHAQEASKDALSQAIMHGADPTNHTGLFNADVQSAARRAELSVRMEDAVREATKPGQPLDPVKRRKVMEDAAEIFLKNPVDKTKFYRVDKIGQLEVTLGNGDNYKVSPPEMTDLKLGAKEAGVAGATQSPSTFAARVRDYHDSFAPAIDKVYPQFNGGESPTGAQAYRVYFEVLKRMKSLGNGNSEYLVRRALMQMKSEEAAKSGQR
jgi:hypothetical protein